MLEGAKRDDFPQLDIITLNEFPIPRIEFTTQEAERARILEQTGALYKEYLLSGEIGMMLSCEADGLSKRDIVHDLLAYLAERMTGLHKHRQAEQRGFLSWLEHYLGAAIDDLNGKTKLREYYDPAQCKDFADLVATLKKNRSKVKRDLTSELVQAPLRKRFDESLAVIGPLLREIDLTDKLIDQLVYKLYGLTDAEVAIVEGRS